LVDLSCQLWASWQLGEWTLLQRPETFLHGFLSFSSWKDFELTYPIAVTSFQMQVYVAAQSTQKGISHVASD
jgi:hypothetical protein